MGRWQRLYLRASLAIITAKSPLSKIPTLSNYNFHWITSYTRGWNHIENPIAIWIISIRLIIIVFKFLVLDFEQKRKVTRMKAQTLSVGVRITTSSKNQVEINRYMNAVTLNNPTTINNYPFMSDIMATHLFKLFIQAHPWFYCDVLFSGWTGC